MYKICQIKYIRLGVMTAYDISVTCSPLRTFGSFKSTIDQALAEKKKQKTKKNKIFRHLSGNDNQQLLGPV